MTKEKIKILFIGDSITDVDRKREEYYDLGSGYTSLIARELKVTYPEFDFEIINRGVSGDKIEDINNRIDADVVSLKPDIVSVLVGVNDTWHNVDSPDFGTAQEAARFKTAYAKFLRTLTQSGVKDIILIEPFLLPIPADRKTWRIDLDKKIHAIRELANEFNTTYLHLDGLFNSLGIKDGYETYADDGVHPTPAGHQLIASHWLNELAPDRFNQ